MCAAKIIVIPVMEMVGSTEHSASMQYNHIKHHSYGSCHQERNYAPEVHNFPVKAIQTIKRGNDS